jgi:cyclopropane-fatty-acyl-phospholipid synthase
MIIQKFADKLFHHLGSIQTGRLEIVTPDGQTRIFEGDNTHHQAKLKLYDWRVVKNMLSKGDIGLAEDYRQGYWETDNLTSLLTLALENQRALEPFITGNALSRVFATLSYLFKLNSIKGSRKNIHAHYDLGNDFYQLWLDPSMTYSSGIFNNSTESLQKGQENKYDRIIEKLGKKSGDLLEIGCGWGGFAERAILKTDYNIKGITLSKEQHDYARDRVNQKARIVLEDYRDQTDRFDSIVSIEMFEAVGEIYWPTYFRKIKSLLKDDGKAVIQTITINNDDFPRYRRSGDFIRSYIFPGGMLPSPACFEQEAKKAGLQVGETFCFGHDYARTLEMWLEKFDEKKKEITDLGFDDGFIRLWRFYLAACIAGFKTKRTDVMQVELTHAA